VKIKVIETGWVALTCSRVLEESFLSSLLLRLDAILLLQPRFRGLVLVGLLVLLELGKE